MKAAAKVVVLGTNVSNTLFGENVDPTDAQIRVRNQVFRVLGVMSSKGTGAAGVNMDDQIFVPYTTVMKKLTGQQNIQRIFAQAKSADDARRRRGGGDRDDAHGARHERR